MARSPVVEPARPSEWAVIAPRPDPAGGGAAVEDATEASARHDPSRDDDGDWLILEPASDPTATESSLSTPWHPANRAGGGQALPPRGGSGSGAQAATFALVQGQVTPLRVPAPQQADAGTGAAGAGGSAALLAAVAGAMGSAGPGAASYPGFAIKSPTAAVPISKPTPISSAPTSPTQSHPPITPDNGGGTGGSSPTGPTFVGGDLTNAPYLVTGNAPTSGLLTPSAAFPLYTLDNNNGVVLFPNVYQFANPGGNVDLRAQVRNTSGPYTFSWNTSNISTLATNIVTSGYKLTFQWNTTITGGPYTATVGLTVTNGSSQQVSQTYTFYVPNGTGTAGTGTMTWPTSLLPDTVLTTAPAWGSQYVSVSADSGALGTQLALPTYNPNVPPVVLSYNSLAADPRPIIVLHHQLDPAKATPTWTSVQLKFNATTGSTYYYDTSQFIPGDIAAIAVQASVPTLATDRYPYTATVVDDRGGTLTTTVYSGNSVLVNESTNAFGDGWTLAGLLRIKTAPSGGGGVILNLGSGHAEWFSGSPGIGGNYTSPAGEFSTLTKTSTGYTRTLTDGTQQVFDSGGNETASVDRNGLRTTYTYSSGLLQSIKDPYLNLVTFTYSSGKLQTIQDPASRLATFTFTGNNLTAAWQNDGTQDVRTSFTYDGSGRMTQYKDPLGRMVTIAYDSAERVGTITRPDSSTQTFTAYQEAGYNTSGTLANPASPTLLAEAQAIYTDPLGNTTDLRADWHGLGLTDQATDAQGNVTTNDSDGNGLATIVIDNLNRVTQDAYDSHGNTTTVIYPDGTTESWTYNGFAEPLTHTDQLSHTTSYTYDGHGNNTVIQDAMLNLTTMTYTANGRLQSVTDANNHTTTYLYDTQDRLTTTIYPDNTTKRMAYDSQGDVTSVVDERGNATTYSFDKLDHQTGMTDALNNKTTIVYDAAGNKTQVQAPTPSGQTPARTTNYAYDSMNRLTTVTDPLGHATVTAYDSGGNVMTVTDPMGRVTSTAYDVLNRPTVNTDPLNHPATTTYDAADQVTQTSDQSDEITTNTYSVRGFLATQTDPLNQVVTYTYSVTGKVLTATYPKQTPSGGGGTAVYTYTYDKDDRLVSVEDPNGQFTTTVYDGVGNKIAVIDANNHTTSYAYDSRDRLTTVTDALGDTTVYGYDSGGNQIRVTDGLGHTTTTLYDALNRATTMISAINGTTTITYDAAGRETSLTDPVGNKTQWAYDSADRMISMTDPLNHTATYVYDADNELTDQTDRDGRRTTFAYDSGGRKTAESWLSGGTTQRTLTYSYDNMGRMTGATDPSAVLTFAYDSGGNLLTAQTSGGGTSGQPNVTLTSTYNNWNDRISLTDNLSSPRTTTFAYDIPGRLTTITMGTGTFPPQIGFTYDGANNITAITRSISSGGGVNTSYAYDAANRLTTQTSQTLGGSNVQTILYGYDAANRLTTQVDAEGTATMTYDKANELTAVGGSRSESYGYDLNGNRDTTGYHTTWMNETTTSPGHTFTYDKEGNLISDNNGSTITTYAYDYRNRLTTVTQGGTIIATYAYDALNRRIGIDDNGTQTWTVYDGNTADDHPYADFNGSGTLLNRYIWGPGVGVAQSQILARISPSGTFSWYLNDRLGSVRDIVSGGGTNLDHIVYDSFGNVTSETNATNGDRFKYAGQEYDATTGQYYDRARYYDEAIGRFMRQDPMGFGAGDGNLYRYVGNRPTSATDPSGLFSIQITDVSRPIRGGPNSWYVEVKGTVEIDKGCALIGVWTSFVDANGMLLRPAPMPAMDIGCLGGQKMSFTAVEDLPNNFFDIRKGGKGPGMVWVEADEVAYAFFSLGYFGPAYAMRVYGPETDWALVPVPAELAPPPEFHAANQSSNNVPASDEMQPPPESPAANQSSNNVPASDEMQPPPESPAANQSNSNTLGSFFNKHT